MKRFSSKSFKQKKLLLAGGFFGFGGGSAATAPSPATGVPAAVPPAAPPAPSGIEDLGSLFASPAAAPASPAGSPAVPASFFSVTGDQLDAGLSKFNFSSTVDPELASKALAGDAASLNQLIDSATRSAISTAVKGSMKLTEEAVNKQFENFMNEKLPEYMQKSRVTETVKENGVFANPAMKPFVDTYIDALATKYPQATQTQLREHTEKHFKAMQDLMTGGKPGSGTPAANDSGAAVDWDSFIKAG